jgi:hypothetical protein
MMENGNVAGKDRKLTCKVKYKYTKSNNKKDVNKTKINKKK